MARTQKKSVDEFKKASTYNDDELKYQLYKKYSMCVDFRIPECQDKMLKAIDYYKSCNLKQYAECLHNYGTGYMLMMDYNNAKKYLKTSIDVLNKICANQIYYPLNSLAILYCYDNHQYQLAIEIIRKALKCEVHELFCKLALHNNLFNIAINMNNIKLAKREKNILEILFKKECNDFKEIQKKHPDIQHQLRQFYYNCAILCKLENNIEEALKNFIRAKKSSIYPSNVVYSIEKNIADLKETQGKNGLYDKIKYKKKPAPTELELYIYKNNAYLCEIMFWG